MQRDCHYYSTLALCIRAGYSPEEAKLIAWANYQCDCTRLTQVKYPWQIFTSVGEFFHFVDRDKIRNYIQILCSFTDTSKAQTSWLIELGIALHAFQDSYSHEGFVGRLDKRNVMGLGRGYWLIPPYAHSQMRRIPDRTECVWTDTRTGEVKNNAEIFSEALYQTYRLIRKPETPAMAGEVERVCFEESYNERKIQWYRLAGFTKIRFSEETKILWPRHKKVFIAAAKRQKEFLS